ncbi:PQQ-binding-like beta-propeller repeat protein [Metabacillus sp. 113a]|uniref:outer membrane protein assembly factor BamB family protein n=1 Tax=Metabacillus sp. 113a TaxID=3404706 RepID=UPI003CEA8C1D
MNYIIRILFSIVTVFILAGCMQQHTDRSMKEHAGKEVSAAAKEQITTQSKEEWMKIDAIKQPSASAITYELSKSNESFTAPFPRKYQDINGILTFRAGPFRNNAYTGSTIIKEESLMNNWAFQTSSSPKWGGGGGWVGQPSVIAWKAKEKEIMNLYPEYKSKKNFREVVFASLDGRVYFLDLETGKATRKPIHIKNPIKGSVALDPRGYPLLYVGQGVPHTGEIGYRIYSLIDGSLLSFIPGEDPYAYRKWGAFDGSPLIHKEEDAMIIAGENGIVYSIKLNTEYIPSEGKISINPAISKYRYKQEGNDYQGVENSIAVYKNLAYFADNGGGIQAIDLIKNEPVWANAPYDDTDATLVVSNEENTPFLYTGSQIDKQGAAGYARIQKINGLNGKIEWEKKLPGFSLLGERPVNGGVLGTPVVGEGALEGQVIYNISRYKSFNGGLLISFDTKTGEEKWRWEMDDYSWSSTVAVYTENDKAYLVQGDSAGNLYLLNHNGNIADKINLGTNIEASPIVIDQSIVIATRGGQLFSIRMK